jgi:signal transduction histidine kinase
MDAIAATSASGSEPPARRSPPEADPPGRRWRRIDPARLRLWGVLVPIHALAFAALYFGTIQLVDRAWTEAGATAARFRLEQAVHDLPTLVASSRAGSNPHVFAHLLAAHQPIGLRLYRGDGTPLGAGNVSHDPDEARRVADYLRDGAAASAVWVESGADRRHWVRGLVPLTAEGPCATCHIAGSRLGIASMKVDFTAQYDEIRRLLGRRVTWLLGAWVALIGGVTVLVQRSVRRSAARLRAELAAVSAGEPGPARAAHLPLDPVAAEVHRNVRDFLARQRARESEVASRLERADQLAGLGQLAAGLAHEIKNPLAGIQGALELLRDEAKDESTRHLHDEMLGELKRVHGILQRLLESGRPAPLRPARLDVGKLLADVAELLAPSLRRRRVELGVETAEALPVIHADAAKLRQVLVNLIQNAAEAMAERGGRVTVRASGFDGDGPDARADSPAVVIAVEDDGPGIAPELATSLFRPFFTTKFSGTGLGLSISKSLIEQHGGRIEVDSILGRGTTFLIFLPERPPALGAEGPEER